MPRIRLLHIELGNACNFRCSFCPTAVSRRPRHSMPLSVFQGIIDQVSEEDLAECVILHLLGEPLLHPDLLRAVRYASDRRLKVIVTTNGSLLSADMIQGLSDSGLYSIDLSLQLLGRERHALRRSHMPYDEYYGRIVESVRTLRERTGIRVIVKVLNTAYERLFTFDKPLGFVQQGREFRALVHQLIMDLYRGRGADIGEREVADRLKTASLNTALRIRLEEGLFVFVQLLMDWGNAFAERKVYPARLGSCSFAFTAPAVLSDGSVVMCCGDYDGHTRLGHIGEGRLSAWLSSDRARRLWEGFERNRVLHPYCQRCLGSSSRLRALGKGLASIFVSKFMRLEGENQLILR
jgi:MoaA/NifB/PqqE/SkfB family radical SAM enzyme